MNENLFSVYEILSLIVDINSENRKQAEKRLDFIKQKGKREYFVNLLEILDNQDIDFQIRRLAGLILKNEFEEFNSEKNSENEKWELILSEKVKMQFKQILIKNLSCNSKIIRRTTSQVLSKIAFIELKNKSWENLFEEFQEYILKVNQENTFYEGILETIDFLFQEFFKKIKIFEIFYEKSNLILEIILLPIKEKNIQGEYINLSALKTLYTLVHFIELEELQCNLIFSLVINQLTNPSQHIRKLSFEILEIMIKRYYRRIGKFISIIFDLTLITIEQDTEEVSLKAIEFWLALADMEFQINVESIQALSEGRIARSYSEQFIIKSGSVFPLLLLTFIENKPVNCSEDWDCKSAAGLCLNLMSQAGPNEILPRVVNYIENKINIYSETNSKQAAAFSFIAIYDGIGAKVLYNHLNKTSFLWLTFSETEDSALKQTIFFLFGKIFQISPFALRIYLDRIVQILLKNIVEKKNKKELLWILNEIFQSFESEGILEWYLETICSITFNMITQMIFEGKIIDELFEIICSIVLNSSIRSQSRLFLLVPSTFAALKSSFNTDAPFLKANTLKIQPHLFRFLGSCIQRFGQNFTTIFVNNIIEFIFFLLEISNKTNLESDLEDEIIIFIGTVTQKFKQDCKILIKNVMPVLFQYINKNIDHQTIAIGIGILGDLSCSYTNLDQFFIKKAIYTLINLLQNDNISLDSKPLILSCLGDISFVTGNYFYEFQNLIVPIIKSTIESVNNYEKHEDHDLFEWILSLKESLLEILTGLIQGNTASISSCKAFETDYEFSWLIKTIYDIVSIDKIERTTKLCIGLVGDCGANYPSNKQKLAKFTWVKQLVFESVSNSYSSLNFMGAWASDSIYGI